MQCAKIEQEFKKGFEFLRALNLPESCCFDGTEIAGILHPRCLKTLHISHIT